MYESFVAAQAQITPAGGLSSKYVHIDTAQIISMLQDEGFSVANVITSNHARDPMRAKHEVDLRLGASVRMLDDGTVPRIVLVNSHDGSSTARFIAGLFRFVCSNGLTTGTAWGNERVRHAGNMAKSIIDRARAAAAQTARTMETAAEWQRKLLTRDQQLQFVQRAAVLRFGDAASRYDVSKMLKVRREGDDRDDLWTVYNRIQEAGLAGGLTGQSANGRRVTTRRLSAIDARLAWNQGLWDLAETMAAEV